MSYQSAFLNARPELQKMLDGLDPADCKTEGLICILKGLDYELLKASQIAPIDRFNIEQNQDGWGRDRPGLGLCLTPEGSLVRYTDHLAKLAVAIGAQS